MNKEGAFTLVELLVVMGVLAIAGTLILVIFTNALKGNNKTQIVRIIKQNGQAVLEKMDKTIRNADNVVCLQGDTFPNTLVVVKNGSYTRFKFIPESNTETGDCRSKNGCILEDFPVQPSSGDKAQIKSFLNNVCTDPMGTDDPSDSYQILTDTNPQTGVSIQEGSFTKNPNTGGFKDSITVKFQVGPATGTPESLRGQIDAVQFQTTVQLR